MDGLKKNRFVLSVYPRFDLHEEISIYLDFVYLSFFLELLVVI